MASRIGTAAVACLVVLGLCRSAVAAPTCPEGASWQVVPDQSPLRACKSGPLAKGCTLPDGRKHGPWTAMDRKTDCRLPARKTTYLNGRREGVEVIWANVCVKGKCVATKAKEGGWVGDRQQGQWAFYGADGRVSARGHWFAGKRHGPWREFSDAAKIVTWMCYQDDKEIWRDPPRPVGAAATAARPCPKVMVVAADDGTKKVSAAEQDASRLVRNAQATHIPRLRVLYLRKAVALVPDNKHYRSLLEAAEAAQARPAPDASPPGS